MKNKIIELLSTTKKGGMRQGSREEGKETGRQEDGRGSSLGLFDVCFNPSTGEARA